MGRFLVLVVGWVERQKNGGFRCYNLILYTSHNMQAMFN
jgi:predicted transcriptional regulator with HTH domain